MSDADINEMECGETTDITEENSTQYSDHEKRRDAVELEEQLANDKNDYYAYEELSQVYRALKNRSKARNTLERFHERFPLTAKIWLAWIDDEKRAEGTESSKDDIVRLYEEAIKDYHHIDIWLDYIQYIMSGSSKEYGVDNVRSLCERALKIAGYHLVKGSLLWTLYINFEKSILLSLNDIQPADIHEHQENILNQKRKIAELYRRELSIPYLNVEYIYNEAIEWIQTEGQGVTSIDRNVLDECYGNSKNKLDAIRDFEKSLTESTRSTTDQYERYLDYERDEGDDVFVVRALYERAVIENARSRRLWSSYVKFTRDRVRVPEECLEIAKRACRNCPEEGDFWARYMELLERYQKGKQEVLDILNLGLGYKLRDPVDYKTLWMSYIYYLRRQLHKIPGENKAEWEALVEEIRAVLELAYTSLMGSIGVDSDPECELLLWWARFEVETTKDTEKYRLLWTQILDEYGHAHSSEYWVKYINMEWQYGDSKHFRRLCERALKAKSDYPESIAKLWLEFETHRGSLDSFQHCQKVCDERIRAWKDEKRKKRDAQARLKASKSGQSAGKGGLQDIRGPSTSVADKSPVNLRQKVSQTVISSPEKKNANSTSRDQNRGNALTEKYSTPVVGPTIPPPSTGGNQYVAHDSSKDERTIFVSNLDYTVTEDQVKEVLQEVGTIEEFRLVRDFKKRSKGYGYLVFSSKEHVEEALKKDRTPLNQRPMFISKCDPDKQTRKKGLRFGTGLEKNKLFVKGLPLTMNQAELEKLFGEYGALKDVRLVTYRNGHSKGLAYVEFVDETSAAHALLKTDGLEIEDRALSVALSNPPERKNTEDGRSLIQENTLGAGLLKSSDTNFGPRGKGRTQLSFVPRSLQFKAPSKSESSMDIDQVQNDQK